MVRAPPSAATACPHLAAAACPPVVGGNWLSRSQLKEDGSAFYDSEHCDSAFMVLKSKEYIRGRQLMDVPWSLHLSLWRPHPPWVCSAPYHEMHDPDHVSPFVRAADPATEAAAHPWLGWNTDTTLPASTMGGDDGLLRHMRSQYLGSVSEVDHHMGTLFDWLKATGEWDRTMIVVTADHVPHPPPHDRSMPPQSLPCHADKDIVRCSVDSCLAFSICNTLPALNARVCSGRAAGRPLATRQAGLLPPEQGDPADHPRPATLGGRRAWAKG